ncbi:hypothetical protein Sjap_002782 [Stephania japonica]|uniref:Uncharacterized protein n=1 Tax=Stephania japonica TaxID=461633 RepID=A0AAP0PSX8_9MAGN
MYTYIMEDRIRRTFFGADQHGWTVYYTLRDRDKLGIVIRSPQATVSLEDRLTAQEVQMTEVLRILRDQGAAISEMAASLTTEPSERQRLYPRLYEGNDRQGFASTKRQAGQSFGAVPQQRHTEVRDEGDQFDRQRQDQQGRQDRHPGQQRGDEGHVVYATAPAPVALASFEVALTSFELQLELDQWEFSFKYWDECLDPRDLEALWGNPEVSKQRIDAGEDRGQKVLLSRDPDGQPYLTQTEMTMLCSYLKKLSGSTLLFTVTILSKLFLKYSLPHIFTSSFKML